jgi:hypothetical protein
MNGFGNGFPLEHMVKIWCQPSQNPGNDWHIQQLGFATRPKSGQ